MDIQLALVVVLFVLATFFLARMLYQNISAKKNSTGCGSGCKCGADFSQAPRKQG